MGPGYRELRESAAWLDLSARGRIFATGKDRVRLLHAMCSNSIRDLEPGQGCYAFFLTPQGRIVGDANIFALPDRILLDVEPELRESIYKHLKKYIIADDVTLEDVSDSLASAGVEGPKAAEALAVMGAPAPEAPYSHLEWQGGIVARASATGAPGFRLFVPRGTLPQVEFADPEAIRVVRLEHGVPRYSEDIFDTTLPQETRQQHALHFAKGCYIGQEIVERIRSRGHVNRLLTSLRVSGELPLAPGTKLTVDGQDAGEITSSAFSPALGHAVALGYVRAQFAGRRLIAAGYCEVDPAPPAGY